MLKEALLFTKDDNNKVRCILCNHRCIISDGKFGICGVRENRNGFLYTHSFGEVVAAHIDPIEKKPIFHLLPGTNSFSIATIGCNFHCGFCQNWQISQAKEADALRTKASSKLTPEDIVNLAQKNRCQSIAYTYTEPTIFFEYALETAKLAKSKGIFNVFVTNGYMTEEAIKIIEPYLDAANVDLKSFSDEFYRKICGARLKPVLESIKLMKSLKIWVEVTTLVVPGTNDSEGELKKIAEFISTVGPDTPWHISRFHPNYRFIDREATDEQQLKKAFSLGKEAGLRYVYMGNVAEEENTYCYSCNKLLIRRFGFSISEYKVKDGRCLNCGTVLDGIIV